MSLARMKQLIASSPPGMVGTIIQGAWVGTFVSTVLITVFLLLQVLLENYNDRGLSVGYLLVWAPIQLLIGLGFLIIAAPAWWLLFLSRRRGMLEAIVVGAILGFLFIIVIWGSGTLAADHDAAWSSHLWKRNLKLAAIQAFAGGLTGWFVHRAVSQAWPSSVTPS